MMIPYYSYWNEIKNGKFSKINDMNDIQEDKDFVDMKTNDVNRDIFMNLDELYVYKGEKISS